MVNSVKFNRGVVLDKATQLFWRKGFYATSMRDLLEAVNLRSGSLYGSFGDKQQIFKESLNYYGYNSIAIVSQYETDYGMALDALKAFARNSILECDSAPSRICMLVKTISELSHEEEVLSELARQWLKVMELAFSKLFEKAKQQGLQNPLPSEMLAKQFQVQVMGLKTYSQANPEPGLLKELTEGLLTAWS